MSMDFSKFITNLRIVRLSQKLSAFELSRQAKLRQMKRVNDIEEGRGKPNIEEIQNLCKVLNVSIDDMLNKTVNVKYEWI